MLEDLSVLMEYWEEDLGLYKQQISHGLINAGRLLQEHRQDQTVYILGALSSNSSFVRRQVCNFTRAIVQLACVAT